MQNCFLWNSEWEREKSKLRGFHNARATNPCPTYPQRLLSPPPPLPLSTSESQPTYPTTNGTACKKWKLSWHTLRTRLAPGLYAQSVLSNWISASELSRKFIQGALSVGLKQQPLNLLAFPQRHGWGRRRKKNCAIPFPTPLLFHVRENFFFGLLLLPSPSRVARSSKKGWLSPQQRSTENRPK